MKFVSTHHHSTFSFMDGFGTPAVHVARAAELGMTAMALTEHGNTSSHVQLEKAASKFGIRPLYGVEAYTAMGPTERRKFHLTILAMNAEGYHNLNRIVSRSWSEGFYQWPTVSGRMLADHHEGLIVLSGCSDSLLACSLLGGKSIEPVDASLKRAERLAEKYRDLLGDRFYLECQAFPELGRTGHINSAYQAMGKKLGIPLVGTADVHYPDPDDNAMQVILHAAGRGAGSVAAQEAGWEYDIRLTHPISDKFILDRLTGTGLSRLSAEAAIDSTAEIASRCNVTLPKADRLRYPLPENSTSLELMWQCLREGWAYRISRGNRSLRAERDRCVEQLKAEMDLISLKDFPDYFLMVSDIIRWAKDNGISVGPGRGSSASSLVCYLLRITEIDPMPFPLMMFSRFIDPTREDLPDIDIDFDDAERWRVRAYAISKYGEERVGNIGTYTRYKGKNSLDDIGRVHPHIPKPLLERAKSMIVERSGGDSRADAALADTVEMFPEVGAIFKRYPDLWKAARLEGNYRGMGVHAAGLVIANRPIAEICARYTKFKKDPLTKDLIPTTVVSVDKKDAEYLGLMKVDLLGLSTMGMISIALRMAGLTLEDLYAVPLDDPETIEGFRRNDVVGIFQIEGRATRLINREVKPSSFLEVVDVNGLSRPGPLFSGATAHYIDVKWGRKKPVKVHPIVDAITAPTNGQVIYQEQVLKILLEFGGLSVTRVHEIRRIISQKLGEAQFNTSSEDFINEAMRLHGVSHSVAAAAWGTCVTSATYAFVYAHSAAYALISWWAMWMKIHYPSAFYAAQLRKTEDSKWARLIKDAESHGIQVRGVDPGTSKEDWEATVVHRADGSTSGVVTAGWLQVPGIGPAKARDIMDYRADLKRAAGSPEWAPAPMSMDDLINVKGIGPKMMEKISAVNPVDPFGLKRIKNSLDEIRSAIRDGDLKMRRPTHTSDQIIDTKDSTVVFLGFVKLKEYKDFLEDERARSGDDMDVITARTKLPHLSTGCVLHAYDDGDEDVYLRFPRMKFPEFKRQLERLDISRHAVLVVARKPKDGFGASLYAQHLTLIAPKG